MIIIVISIAGLALYLWPFLFASAPGISLFSIFCITAIAAAIAAETLARKLDNRRLALLIAIVSLDSALRAVLVTGIGGFSPIYLLIICAGYVFGPSYGFLCGGITLLASGAITGGIGPWIPYEFFATAWVGAGAGILGQLRRNQAAFNKADLLLLLTIGIIFGYLCGALADIFDWTTYWRGTPGLGWIPGATLATNAANFWRFYLSTSLAWDQLRVVGNVILLLLLAKPIIAALRRLQQRYSLVILASTALPESGIPQIQPGAVLSDSY